MKGDFSEWEFDSKSNEIGVLHQQGRGLLDQDWNAATVIDATQRQILASDAIGSSVAAVPAEAKDSFKVTQADADASGVNISLNPGRVWVDGFVIQVDDWPSVQQPATYLEPPFHSPAVDTSSIAAGVRDALILEVWPESLNAFQDPLRLLEPALGGVDTTERAKLYHRLRLLRLEADDDCGNLADKLADDFAAKGKLTVTAEEVSISGDCPVDAGGGYTGFEHYLMRVEIAEPDGTDAQFKWSRFNGGLVGRGIKSTTEDMVTITANDQMINHCGLNTFYLEALLENPDTGVWEIMFTAEATLSTDGELDLANMSGTWPGGDGNEAFFRLWDGIDLISNFPLSADPDELALGLRLQFEAAAADNSNYTPGDYWTFPVRAVGAVGFDADEAWPNNSTPQGVHYMRVPLAILTWDSAVPSSISAPDQIHDCRHVFQPLAQLDSCCSYTVGDGHISHGDFDRIQEAIDALPAAGGEICVLDGTFEETLIIVKDNVSIHGCGTRTHLIADTDKPAIYITNASHVHIHNIQITAHDDGIGVLLNGGAAVIPDRTDRPLETRLNATDQPTEAANNAATEKTEIGAGKVPEHIILENILINAATHSAIEARAARYLTIRDNKLLMQDVPSAYHALYLTADDVLVEHNEITVKPTRVDDVGDNEVVVAGRGGVQLGGTSERIQIIDNLIKGGISNGITLGTLIEVDDQGLVINFHPGWVVNKFDPCDPCAPGTNEVPTDDGSGDTPTYESAGALYDIRIERNRIQDFGLNGIGVVGFFDLAEEDEFISVNNLQILGNNIADCLSRELEVIPDNMQMAMGYGGISLADVDNLVVHDNVIEDNGPSNLEPICGIFVLHAEGIDISRNRILNNGKKTSQTTKGASQGPRGGIHIIYATAPKRIVVTGHEYYPRQNGVTALKVHDNIVSQPLGRALSVTALGPVSVNGNQLTSQGFLSELGAPSFFAATVFIANLGISNEWYLQQILYSGDTLDDFGAVASGKDDPDFIVEAQPGLDTQQLFAYLGNGNVQFSANQVMLDLTDETGFTLGFSSIVIASLDDIAFESNQCDISYDFALDDFLLSNAIIFGWTSRVIGNRFKESILGTLLSALTLSLVSNHTLANQATHCIMAYNLLGAAYMEDEPNTILFDIFGLCKDDDPFKLRAQATTSPLVRAERAPQPTLSLLQ